MPVISLTANTHLTNVGVTTIGEDELTDDNIASLSDNNASTGISFTSLNSYIVLGFTNLIFTIEEIEEVTITNVSVYCNIEQLLGKYRISLSGTTNTNAEIPAGLSHISNYTIADGGIGENINLASLGLTSITDINNLILGISSLTAGTIISEVRVDVTYTLPVPGKVIISEGKVLLQKGKLKMV